MHNTYSFVWEGRRRWGFLLTCWSSLDAIFKIVLQNAFTGFNEQGVVDQELEGPTFCCSEDLSWVRTGCTCTSTSRELAQESAAMYSTFSRATVRRALCKNVR